MARLAATLAGGVLIGILLMLALNGMRQPEIAAPETITRNITAKTQVTPDVAESLRDEHYASLTSVEDVIALPSEFARIEALYVLAGRSESAETQGLIFEASRIADDVQRRDMLRILFARLAEIDPQSALALARTDAFRAIRSIERTVWQIWARNDLEEALFAAKTQTSDSNQRNAAQSLYGAFGYMGNETTERIEAELGIGPDRSTRAWYLYSIADRSVAEAIAFINSVTSDVERLDYVTILGNYLASKDPSAMLVYADQLTDTAIRNRFAHLLNDADARANPQAVIDNYLAGQTPISTSPNIYSACVTLAAEDLDLAQQYFDESTSQEFRQMMGSAIAAQIAKEDPAAALVWARAKDKHRFGMLQQSVLHQMARTDPRTAFTEALKVPDEQARFVLVSNMISSLAMTDPAEAAVYLAEISEPQLRASATGQFLTSWMSRDRDAAMDWILSQDEKTQSDLLGKSADWLFHTDIDATIQILPRLDKSTQHGLRQRIAHRLATQRSPTDAQQFIQQFEGEADYEQLRASVIAGVAQSDAMLARQLAAQLSDDRARDSAYVQIISQQSRSDPAEAARWLTSISDQSLRASATSQVVRIWHGRDPTAALNWVTQLPAGSARDDALLSLATQLREPTPQQQDLIASIQDPVKREQARVGAILNIARTNPTKAREMLRQLDMPDAQRRQIEQMLSNLRLGY